MARRSTNSQAEKMNRLPFFARLLREPPFSSADERELEQAANCFAGPTGWYATAPRYPDTGGRFYRFATSSEAEAMQSGSMSPASKIDRPQECGRAQGSRSDGDWPMAPSALHRLQQVRDSGFSDWAAWGLRPGGAHRRPRRPRSWCASLATAWPASASSRATWRPGPDNAGNHRLPGQVLSLFSVGISNL